MGTVHATGAHSGAGELGGLSIGGINVDELARTNTSTGSGGLGWAKMPENRKTSRLPK